VNRPFDHFLILAAACIFTFWNTFHNGFHLDDAFRVLNNPGVQEFWPPWRHFVDPSTCSHLPRLVQYRPMLPLSLSINYAIAGDSVVGYHIGNLLLQFLASSAVFLFVRELFTHWSKVQYPRHAALLVAVLFAVHPVSGIPVNYVCGRDLLMMQMFLFASLTCYARMRRLGETKGRWVLSLALLLLALLSKKNAVVIPALVLFFDLLLARDSIMSRGLWRRAGIFAGVVALLLCYIKFGLDFSDYENVATHSPMRYAAAQGQHHVFHYLRNFVWPFSIHVLPAEPVETWKQVAGIGFILASLAGIWIWWKTQPMRAFCIVGYAALIAVTSSVIPMHSEIVPYRAYPSGAFLFLFAVTILSRKGRLGMAALSAMAIYFAMATISTNRTWHDSVSLLRHSVEQGANNIAYGMLAERLPIGAEKEKMFLKAIELEPGFTGAHLGLAMTHVKMGKTQEGLDRLQEWVGRAPNNAQVRYAAGRILSMAGKVIAAASQSEIAMGLDPDNSEYRHMAGKLAVEAKRYAKAFEILKPLLDYRPDYRATRFHAGVALRNMDRANDAIILLEHYAATHGGGAKALYELGRAKMSVSDWRGAAQAFKGCLLADPAFGDARQKLAECQRRRG
jgi:tetratricopeptide (TPR) repeat protein